MEELLFSFAPITLDEMSGVKLMNRTDTKFVTSMPMLIRLLEMAQGDYYAQEIDGEHESFMVVDLNDALNIIDKYNVERSE